MSGGIEVVESGLVLAADVSWARSWRDRSRGLLGSELQADQALVLEPAKQVHTFGMKYPIDVIFCDRGWVVKHVVRSMEPRRVTKIVFGSRFAIELPGGTVPGSLAPGTVLRVESGE